MAISARIGAVANSNNAAVASLATAAFTAVASARTLVVVTLLDNTKSVSTMPTNGTGTYALVAALNISATLRIELWQSTNESSGTGRVVTANFSASVVSAIALEQWSGDIALLSGNPTDSGTNYFPKGRFAVVYSGDFAISFLGFNGSSGDTITAQTGNLRRSSIGAAGGAGVAIVDSGAAALTGSLLQEVKLNNFREWGSIGAGLQATSTSIEGYELANQASPGFVNEPIFVSAGAPQGGGGGILPPSGAHGQLFPPAII